MKKIYFSLIAFAMLSVNAAAQLAQPQQHDNFLRNFKPAPQLPGDESPKALGIEIWSNNFDNPSDWVIDNDGQTGAGYGWDISSTEESWYFNTVISSTSGGNFAELGNGVPSPSPGTQALNVDYYLTIAAGIDIPNLPANTSNMDQVTLQFKQYGARFNDLQELQISTDGVVWVSVWNNDYHPVLSSSAPNNAYANAETVNVNLAPFISGNANNFWFRFHWTTNFPTSATNPNVWVTYGWMLDDIKLITNPDNDLEAQTPYWGTAFLNYYQIPITQTAPIEFTTNAFNNGIATQTNSHLYVDITGVETFSGVSQMANINPNSSDSLVLTSTFTPATLGTYNVTWEVQQDQVDDVPANNVNTPFSFDVTQYTYARDNGTQNSTNSNSGQGYEVGNLYDIWADQNVYAIDVRLASGTTGTQVGSIVYGKIYWIDPNATGTLGDIIVQVGQTDYHDIIASDLTSVLKLPLITPIQLDATQTYFVVIGSDGDGGATNDVVCAAAGTSDPQTSFLYRADTDTWYYTTRTPMVRLDFNANGWGIEEVEGLNSFQVYPNPADEVLNVAYELSEGSAVTFEVRDITGKVISSKQVSNGTGANQLTIQTASFESGVYFVNLITNNGVTTRRFVKK